MGIPRKLVRLPTLRASCAGLLEHVLQSLPPLAGESRSDGVQNHLVDAHVPDERLGAQQVVVLDWDSKGQSLDVFVWSHLDTMVLDRPLTDL